MKDLAVVIPVYNDQQSLDRTLESIREDTNRFTVIAVDDGSREPIVVDPNQCPFPVVVIRQTPNGGIVKALNRGLSFAREHGFRYIARLDAADLNRENRFTTQYQFLEEHAGIAMVGSNVVFLEEENEAPLFTTNLPLLSEDIHRWMVFRNCFIHPSVMFRSECLETTGLYESKYPHIEDFVFFTEFVKNFPCQNLEEPLVDCFVRAGGISMKHRKSQLKSGLRYQFDHPRLLQPLWYAYLLKRSLYFFVPFEWRNRVKKLLRFSHTTQSGDNQSEKVASKSQTAGVR